MKGLYVKYCIEFDAWFVCRTVGIYCEKVTGPWDTEAVANLSLEIQQPITKF